MKKTLLTMGLMANSILAFSQTPQVVPATGIYSENFNSLDGTSTTYPNGFQGVIISTSVPSSAGRLNDAGTAINLKAGGTAETNSQGVYDFTGKIGMFSSGAADNAIILALNTSAVAANKFVQIKFDAMVMRNLYDGTNNNYIQGMAFMYRIGSSGAYTLVNNDFITNETTVNTTGTTGVNLKSLTYTLPAACSNQPVVQLRWVMRTLAGTAPTGGTDRPSFAIDNVSAQAVASLPVTISSFIGKNENESVKLSWTTTSEKNNLRFDILRSGDDKAFSKIGEVEGNDNANNAIDYFFTDRSPLAGNNYYTLKQIDKDGQSEEFGPVTVATDIKTTNLNAYAAKDKPEVNVVVFSQVTGNASIKIFDMNGRNLAQQTVSLEKGTNQFVVPVKNMGKGIYVTTLESASINMSRKFVK